DGLTVDCVEEAVGVPGFLDDLRAALKDGSFRPLPVRERKIPTPGGSGKLRKLGIPARFMIVEGLPRYAPKRLRGQAQPTKPGHLMGSRSSYAGFVTATPRRDTMLRWLTLLQEAPLSVTW